MVDRIDKPVKPDMYRVEQSTETKRDKQKSNQNSQENSEFQQQRRELFDKKFAADAIRAKTFRIPISKIDRLTFKKAIPYHGSATCEANLHWKDGRITENAGFLLKNWQDFLRLKNLKSGETVEPSFWKTEKPYLEITVRQQGPTSGSLNLREIQKLDQNSAEHIGTAPRSKRETLLRLFGIQNAKGDKNRVAIGLYGIGFFLVIAVLALLIGI